MLYLQFKEILENTVEKFDISETQGVAGLKALRIKIKNESNYPIEAINFEQLYD